MKRFNLSDISYLNRHVGEVEKAKLSIEYKDLISKFDEIFEINQKLMNLHRYTIMSQEEILNAKATGKEKASVDIFQ